MTCRCTGRNCETACRKKVKFLSKCCDDGIFGYINVENGKLLGGAEYVPSAFAPYDIPKDEKTAFLTCAYLSSREHDYKTAPLQALEKHLKRRYERLLAISGEAEVFPNGDLRWFLDQGFRDKGIVSVEAGYRKLHLVSKAL